MKIGRPAYTAPARDWPPGTEFITRLTRTPGCVLEVRRDRVLVLLYPDDPLRAQERTLHPAVILEAP